MSFSGTYFDGRSIRGRRVDVDVLRDHSLLLRDGEFSVAAPRGTFSFPGPLAAIPRFALLPGGLLEVPSTAEAEAALAVFAPSGALNRVELWLGARIRVAAAISAALVAVGALFVFRGLPAMARRIAYAVPTQVEARIGLASQAALKKFVVSELFGSDGVAQARAEHQLRRMAGARHLHVEPTLVVINLAQANAFALPGGTIIVTTGLMRINLTDDEMGAVMAHELGHEEQRHGLQSILRQSSALIVVCVMTGDLATLTSFSGSLPFLLITRGYSRDFEREADAFAVDLLKSAGVDPEALAGALEKIEKASGGGKVAAGYLSTHPNTAERIAVIRNANAKIVPADYPTLVRRARDSSPSDGRASVERYKEAFKVQNPDASDLYDAAVSAASISDRDDAFLWLTAAVRGGLKDSRAKINSHQLISLHSDPRWRPLLAQALLADKAGDGAGESRGAAK